MADERNENSIDEDLSEASSASHPRPVKNEAVQAQERRPRARAPEKAEDLVSLRELANLSAQSALDTHARSRLMKSVNAKLAVVAVALATAGVLFWRWAAVPESVTHYYMGLAVILVAVLWGVQYAALAGYAYLTSGGGNAVGGKGRSEPVDGAISARTCFAEEPTAAEVLDGGTDSRDVPSDFA